MPDKSLDKKTKITLAILLAIFFVFFYILSTVTPVAGDDWGYAVTSLTKHPLILAFERYFNWSGRFFSELWGFLLPRNKWLWDLVNPGLFVGLLVMMLKLTWEKKDFVMKTLVLILLVLSVSNGLRMQTYTWTMGSTYVVPLLGFLVYLLLLKRLLLEGDDSKRTKILLMALSFCIPLWMENIGAVMVGANVLVLLYCVLEKKQNTKDLGLLVGLSVLSFAILRLSPGSNYRLLHEHVAFNELSLFGKIASNWNAFLQFTFLDNKVIIFILSLCLFALVLGKRKQTKLSPGMTIGMSVPLLFGLIQSGGTLISTYYPLPFLALLTDLTVTEAVLLLSVGYALYIVDLFFIFSTCLEEDKRVFTNLVLLCAGAGNLVMLVSPIFAERSSIYTTFLLMLVVGLVLEELAVKPIYAATISLVAFLGCAFYAIPMGKVYYQVYQTNRLRTLQIQEYQAYPEGVTELYIARMPQNSIHSADVEEDDAYHMRFFKEYYHISPEVEVRFYYLDSYEFGGQ